MKRFVTYIVLPFVTLAALAQSDVDTQQMYKFIIDICIPVKPL